MVENAKATTGWNFDCVKRMELVVSGFGHWIAIHLSSGSMTNAPRPIASFDSR